MPVGSGAPFRLRSHTMKLAAGTRLFHIFPGTRDPLSANPAARARFARPGVASMYYTATSTDIAIWEIVLRDKIYVGGALVLDVAELSPWKIAEVELLRDVQFISLEERHLGHVAATVFAKIRLRECCGCDPDEYPKTHDAANRLLAVSPSAEAIAWRSAQCGESYCMLFYGDDLSPPALRTDLFRVVGRQLLLAGVKGRALVNSVIERNGLTWAKPPRRTP
jgi:hypothetical protein